MSNRIFALLAIALVAVSIPVTIYLVQRGSFDFKINAFTSDDPVRVVISDVDAQGFRVSWLTEKSVIGSIKLDGDNVRVINEDKAATSHTVLLENLQPGTYQFSLLSDGKEYKDGESFYKAALGLLKKSKSSQLIYGQIFAKTGTSFQQGGIIQAELSQGSLKSQVLATTINQAGGYQIDLGNILTKDLAASFTTSGIIDITFTISPSSLAEDKNIIKKYTLDLQSTKQIPNIYLGDVNLDIIPGVSGN